MLNNDKSRVVQQAGCQSLDKLKPTEKKCLAQLGIGSCNCWGSKEGRQAVSAEGEAPCLRKPQLSRWFCVCGEQGRYMWWGVA